MVVVPGRGVARPERAALSWPRILVVDSQPLFAVVLSHLLAGPALGAQTLCAATTDAALEFLCGEPVDVVLCDVRVQPLPLQDFLSELARLPAPPPVILLADVQDEVPLMAAIETGAAGFFTKDADPDQFLQGVRAVLAGHKALGENVMRSMLGRLNMQDSANQPPAGLAQLSRTELDILTMIGAASSVPTIAAARRISQKTVRNHMANIYRKLGLRSRTQAMLLAARMGLVAE